MATTAVQQVYINAKADLATLIATETAYQIINGPKPSYSLDGESYDWPGWIRATQEAIDKFDALIQREDGAFEVISYGHI